MPNLSPAPSSRPDSREHAWPTEHGVCLWCGEGVLESGVHITGGREPCASIIALLAEIERLEGERDAARLIPPFIRQTLERALRRDMTKPPVTRAELQQAVDLLPASPSFYSSVAGIEQLAAAEALAERRGALAEMAWTIIANAGEGNWDTQADDWRAAAVKWRDEYHAALAGGGQGDSAS